LGISRKGQFKALDGGLEIVASDCGAGLLEEIVEGVVDDAASALGGSFCDRLT